MPLEGFLCFSICKLDFYIMLSHNMANNGVKLKFN